MLRYLLCCVFVLLMGLSGGREARALDLTWNLSLGTRFLWEENALNASRFPIQFDQQYIGGSLLAGFGLNVNWNNYISNNLQLDIGQFLIASQTIANESSFFIELNSATVYSSPNPPESFDLLQYLLEESFYIRELAFTFAFNKERWVRLKAGMNALVLGRSLLYDNFSLGAQLTVNVKERGGKAALPLRWIFDAFLPDSSFTAAGKMSPVLHTRFDYIMPKDSYVGLFAAYVYDGNSLASTLLQPIFQESILVDLEDLYRSRYRRETQIECLVTYSRPEVKSPHLTIKALNASAYDNLQKCESGEKTCTEEQIAGYKETLSSPVEVQALQVDFNRQQARIRSQNPDALSPLQHYNNACSGLMESSGHHFWVGVQGDVRLGRLRLEGSAILYASSVRLVLSRAPIRSDSNTYQSRSNRTTRFNSQRTSTLRRSLLSPHQNIPADPDATIVDDKFLTGVGFATELQATYDWHPMFSTSLFFVYASGDRVDINNKDTFHAFMGLSSQIRYTNIFFNGGINSSSSQRNISIAGLTGRGVIAPGVSLTFRVPMATPSVDDDDDDDDDSPTTQTKPSASSLPTSRTNAAVAPAPSTKPGSRAVAKKPSDDDEDDDEDKEKKEKVYLFQTKLTAAPIWSQARPLINRTANVGNFYGFEVDLEGSLRLLRWLDAVFELDFFFPGDFFASASNLPVFVRFQVGLNFKFGQTTKSK